ncbi:hypothetical protein AB0C34_17950 [Nocardia sp. NPDC049220]|uniref:hypothetical protein n=1 Tax=Nocardia sp. NPDC049220 TaxID=3155273 RepID=UPI0033C82413
MTTFADHDLGPLATDLTSAVHEAPTPDSPIQWHMPGESAIDETMVEPTSGAQQDTSFEGTDGHSVGETSSVNTLDDSVTTPPNIAVEASAHQDTDPDARHREALNAWPEVVTKVLYACVVLGDVDDLNALKPQTVIQWLELLTGESYEKRKKFSEYISEWRAWVSAQREGAHPPVPKVRPAHWQQLDEFYRDVYKPEDLPEWLTTVEPDVAAAAPASRCGNEGAPTVAGTNDGHDITYAATDNGGTGDMGIAPQQLAPVQGDWADREPQLSSVPVSTAQEDSSPNETDVMAVVYPEMAAQDLTPQERIVRGRAAREIQQDPDLFTEWSEDEMGIERGQAETIRALQRKERLDVAKAQIKERTEFRKATAALRKAEVKDRITARRALAAQRRATSIHARTATLFNYQRRSTWAIGVVVAIGLGWSATNVQHNVAPGLGASEPLYWFSFLLEAMISLCLIVIMFGKPKLAEWNVQPKNATWAEVGLLALTVGLNTFPFIQKREGVEFMVHGAAPVMIGVALLIHHAVSDGYGKAIARAAKQLPPDLDLPDPNIDTDTSTGSYLDADPLVQLNSAESDQHSFRVSRE